MRAFMILCLTSLAVAAPEGYNYAVNQGSSIGANSLHAAAALQSSGLGGSSGFGGSFPSGGGDFVAQPQANYLPPAAGGSGGGGYSYHDQQPIVSKRFFLHSAPEEDEDEVQHRHLTIGHPRKNYNVVFIKAPAKAAQKTVLKISPAVNEEKTVVYVLNKKGEEAQIDTHVLEHATTTAKPEVYFIKYKTNEEAEHAQRTIQSQYDSLGGSSLVSNEGYAPVSSVIGSLGGGHGGGYGGHHGGASGHGGSSLDFGGGGSASNAYLPPAKLRH